MVNIFLLNDRRLQFKSEVCCNEWIFLLHDIHSPPKSIGTARQNFGPNFYKFHVSEEVRSNFGGKIKCLQQEISKINI